MQINSRLTNECKKKKHPKTNKVEGISTYLSIITPTVRLRLADQIKNQTKQCVACKKYTLQRYMHTKKGGK